VRESYASGAAGARGYSGSSSVVPMAGGKVSYDRLIFSSREVEQIVPMEWT
jgi:hypothetical protein